jgi:hypothetical protein
MSSRNGAIRLLVLVFYLPSYSRRPSPRSCQERLLGWFLYRKQLCPASQGIAVLIDANSRAINPACKQGIPTTARGCMLLELHAPQVAHKRDKLCGEEDGDNISPPRLRIPPGGIGRGKTTAGDLRGVSRSHVRDGHAALSEPPARASEVSRDGASLHGAEHRTAPDSITSLSPSSGPSGPRT